MNMDYDLLAQQYALHRQVQPDVLKSLIQDSQINEGSRVLEVGCGTGNYIIALQGVVGCAAWGVEPSPQMLATAGARTTQVHFQPGRAEQLAYPAGFFDLIFSVDVIHHVQDRAAYFAEAYRILKPGGKICTVTDSEEIIRTRQPLSSYFPETIEVELQRYPAISDVGAMMSSAGFHDQQASTADFAYLLDDVQIYRDKAFSCLHLIPEEAFVRGMQQMERDLQVGPIVCRSRYLLLWGAK
jgi:ubiquinone/menaquinone biosynthesis C-methylase UbiE